MAVPPLHAPACPTANHCRQLVSEFWCCRRLCGHSDLHHPLCQIPQSTPSTTLSILAGTLLSRIRFCRRSTVDAGPSVRRLPFGRGPGASATIIGFRGTWTYISHVVRSLTASSIGLQAEVGSTILDLNRRSESRARLCSSRIDSNSSTRFARQWYVTELH